MARNTIYFEHPQTGQTTQADVGFCWRLLQFGAFWPMYQRQWRLSLWVLLGAMLSFGVSNTVLAFYYNKIYIKTLLAAGFLPTGSEHGCLPDLEQDLGINLPQRVTASC
jgi:hypothetical protein